MTSLARRIILLPVLACLLPGPVRCEEAGSAPFQLVRSLRATQDQIAQGDAAAHAGQRKHLADIAAQLVNANAKAWNDPKNARAAVIYVLSGGDPGVLRGLRDLGALQGVDENTVKGALAYGEGRNAEAEALLGIDARSLDPTIGGHIALVQSVLTTKKDANKALAFLDEARLLSPGTLVEEAALRRQTFLVAATGALDKFEMLSRRYLRRFGSSVYANSFRRQFAAEVANQKYDSDPERLARLEVVLGSLSSADQRDIYLTIAEEGIARGKVELTRLAARDASRLTEDGSVERSRARLYEGAALIVTEQFEKGFAALKRIDRTRLGPADAELLDAAASLASEVRRWPEPSDTVGSLQDLEKRATQVDRASVLATSNVIKAAEKAMAHVDQLLNGASK
jgi:chemotaxis protein MotC